MSFEQPVAVLLLCDGNYISVITDWHVMLTCIAGSGYNQLRGGSTRWEGKARQTAATWVPGQSRSSQTCIDTMTYIQCCSVL